MIFDSRASLLCRSINPVRFTLIMSTCHSVTSPSPPSTFPHTYAHPLMYLLSPSNHNPRRPVPKTHQSVGHSTKDDKGPAGIKWGNRDSKEVKDRKRKKRGEILSFSQRPPPLSTQPLGPWELRNDKRDRRKKRKNNTDEWMNELRNEWRGLRVKGQTRNRGERKGAPGSLSRLPSARHKRRTSVRSIRVHLSLYILNITKFKLKHNYDSGGLYKVKLKKHNVYTTSAVPLGFILLIMWCCNLSDLFNVFDNLLFFFFFFVVVWRYKGSRGSG